MWRYIVLYVNLNEVIKEKTKKITMVFLYGIMHLSGKYCLGDIAKENMFYHIFNCKTNMAEAMYSMAQCVLK